jgi:N-dimethylarginine dimethylaminohydrolase
MERLLVCRPQYFNIAYEINPWMHVKTKVAQEKAIEQWNALELIYKKLKVNLEEVPPADGLPDLVFTANAGVVRGKVFIPSRFRHKERQGEEEHFIRWFTKNGYSIKEISEEHRFEGAGDALFLDDTLFAGYHFRSDIHSHKEVSKILDVPTLSLELVDRRFYHLDTCFLLSRSL